MSDKVAVYNSNIYPHTEKFRDDLITIPEKGHIMMDRDEAVLFLGQMNQPVLDADGNHTAQGFKMLKILGDGATELKPAIDLRCNACGQTFKQEGELQSHILANHVNQFENKEKAMDAMKEPTIEEIVRKRKTAKKA